MSTVIAPVTPPTKSPTQGGGQAGAQPAPAGGNSAARLPVADPAPSAATSVSLSAQGLQARVDELEPRTVDVAQRFLSHFVGALFGDLSAGARFDSLSLRADASLAGTVTWPGNADTTSAVLDFSESAHFVGKGQLSTADGQAYNFELEVSFEARLQAGRAQGADILSAPDLSTLVGKQLPSIAFPGSLADLFKVLGRTLTGTADSGKQDGASGALSLRLLRLVNSAALLAPRRPADQPAATQAERGKALASYASTGAASL